jgi:DnaJ-class molecular chaperone
MICDRCHGNGYIIIIVKIDDGTATYEPIDCPDCLGVGEILAEATPKYPGTHGEDERYDAE